MKNTLLTVKNVEHKYIFLKDVDDSKKTRNLKKIAQNYLYLTILPSYDEFINCLPLECLKLSI